VRASHPALPIRAVPLLCALAALLLLEWNGLATTGDIGFLPYVNVAIAVVGAVAAARASKDGFNSLTVMLGLCLLTIGLPFLALAIVLPDSEFLRSFGLSVDDLRDGAHLATAAMLGVVLGWHACPMWLTGLFGRAHAWAATWLRDDPRLLPSGIVGFAAGCTAFVIFLMLNFGDPVSAVSSGVARGQVAPGTSRYGLAASAFLTTSSVLLGLQLGRRWGRRAIVFAPALGAGALLTVFGGRLVALTPLILTIIGVRYLSPSPAPESRAPRQRPLFATAGIGMLVVVGVISFMAFVPQYRGTGPTTVTGSLGVSAVTQYFESRVWVELSDLHPYALALRLGEGALDGSTYYEMFGPVGELVGLDGERPGGVIVRQFIPGQSGATWGIQTGLIVDVFVNTGMTGALLVTLLFGAILRADYVGFNATRRAFGSIFLHCLILWTMVLVYFESVVSFLSLIQVALPIALLISILARLLPLRAS
jgi:hypothetical protein